MCSVLRPSVASMCRAVSRQLADSLRRFPARRTRLETLSVPVRPNEDPSSASVAPVQRRHCRAARSRPAGELRNTAYCEASTPWWEAVQLRIWCMLTLCNRLLVDSCQCRSVPSASPTIRRRKPSLPKTHSRNSFLNATNGLASSKRREQSIRSVGPHLQALL